MAALDATNAKPMLAAAIPMVFMNPHKGRLDVGMKLLCHRLIVNAYRGGRS
jgi:hypothetical protein